MPNFLDVKNPLLLFLLFVLPAGLTAQAGDLPSFITDSLDRYVERGMEQWKIPGLALGVVKDGEIILSTGYGVTRAGGSEAVDAHTLFMIGSNTKAFTATALALLEREGEFSLQDKVRNWLPDFRLNDPLATRDANLVDMLSHRVGFETFQGDFTYWESNLSREEVVRKMRHIEAPYPFRTRWGYCNACFVAAGEVIPRVTGQSWEATVRDSILEPLGMDRTFMLVTDIQDEGNKAHPHTVAEEELLEVPFVDIGNLGPAGSMISSAHDMSRWLKAQLGNGYLDGEAVLRPSAVVALREPASIVRVNRNFQQKNHFNLYGLGLGLSDRDGKLVYGHTGGVNGYLSSVTFIPELALGVVVLTNTDKNQFYQALNDQIVDAFLGLPYEDQSARTLKQFSSYQNMLAAMEKKDRELAARNNPPPAPLAAFEGTYINERYGKVDIRLVDGQLQMRFAHHPDLTASLAYMADQRFLCTFSSRILGYSVVPFTLEQGEVKGFTLRVADFIERNDYAFVKE